MSCQICVEVCPFEAIKMDKVFELSRRERFDALLMRKERSREIERLLSQHSSARSRSGRRGARRGGGEKEAGPGRGGTPASDLRPRGGIVAQLSTGAAR